MPTNLMPSPRPSNGELIWLRVLEFNVQRQPTGRVVSVPILSFTKARDGYGSRRQPILPATRINDSQLRVKCPYCGSTHLHGLGGSGGREADCGRGGYVLREVDE